MSGHLGHTQAATHPSHTPGASGVARPADTIQKAVDTLDMGHGSRLDHRWCLLHVGAANPWAGKLNPMRPRRRSLPENAGSA